MIKFYENIDDFGTIVFETNDVNECYDAFEQLEKEYPNEGIHCGGILEIETV
jgi:hypothetical protein